VGCAPTPPDDFPLPAGDAGKPGGGEFLEEPLVGHCPCCETFHFLEHPVSTYTESGMLVVKGRCERCGADSVIYPKAG
jgi:hypothetical protein